MRKLPIIAERPAAVPLGWELGSVSGTGLPVVHHRGDLLPALGGGDGRQHVGAAHGAGRLPRLVDRHLRQRQWVRLQSMGRIRLAGRRWQHLIQKCEALCQLAERAVDSRSPEKLPSQQAGGLAPDANVCIQPASWQQLSCR